MKFPLSWLKRYLLTEASLHELTEAMTMSGMEVEHIHDPAQNLAGINVAQILSVDAHPNADRLSLCKLETLDGIKNVVCGAPNVAAEMFVLHAPPGCFIPGTGKKLDKTARKIRGVESHGMICSASELNVGDQHDKIMQLHGTPDIGTPAAQVLGLDDPVIEIEVTPNRPDLLGLLGIARDLAAAGIGSFSDSHFEPIPESFPCPVKITIRNTKACPLFAVRLIRGVSNKPSPDWLKMALAAAGIQPRNILVDVTNFLCLDRARPLHVFDADKLDPDLLIGMGQTGWKLKALDGNLYQTGPEVCVVSDSNGPLSIGGIIGGNDSAVCNQTKNVLLECACFDPAVIARAGRSLNLDSEARRRFERGVDVNSIQDGINRASRMILELAGGEASTLHIQGKTPPPPQPIRFPLSEVERLTGFAPSLQESQKILTRLGCQVRDSIVSGNLQVQPPGFRPDLQAPADLVEEIMRLVGYHKLPEKRLAPAPVLPVNEDQLRSGVARRVMAARGFCECLSWSFMDGSLAAQYQQDDIPEQARISNPIVAEMNVMRPSLLPNLAAAIARNVARGTRDIRLFEASSIWQSSQTENLQQHSSLAALVHPCQQRHWAGDIPPYDAIAAKGDLLALLDVLGWPATRFRPGIAPAHWHPGHSAALFLGKVRIADFGSLHPRRLAEQNINSPLFGFELYLDSLPHKRRSVSRPALQKHDQTPIIRDLAFEIDDDKPAGELVRIAMAVDPGLIESARVFDVYKGEALGKNRKSIAVELLIRPQGQPLSEKNISNLCERIIQKITRATGATLRQ